MSSCFINPLFISRWYFISLYNYLLDLYFKDISCSFIAIMTRTNFDPFHFYNHVLTESQRESTALVNIRVQYLLMFKSCAFHLIAYHSAESKFDSLFARLCFRPTWKLKKLHLEWQLGWFCLFVKGIVLIMKFFLLWNDGVCTHYICGKLVINLFKT